MRHRSFIHNEDSSFMLDFWQKSVKIQFFFSSKSPLAKSSTLGFYAVDQWRQTNFPPFGNIFSQSENEKTKKKICDGLCLFTLSKGNSLVNVFGVQKHDDNACYLDFIEISFSNSERLAFFFFLFWNDNGRYVIKLCHFRWLTCRRISFRKHIPSEFYSVVAIFCKSKISFLVIETI